MKDSKFISKDDLTIGLPILALTILLLFGVLMALKFQLDSKKQAQHTVYVEFLQENLRENIFGLRTLQASEYLPLYPESHDLRFEYNWESLDYPSHSYSKSVHFDYDTAKIRIRNRIIERSPLDSSLYGQFDVILNDLPETTYRVRIVETSWPTRLAARAKSNHWIKYTIEEVKECWRMEKVLCIRERARSKRALFCFSMPYSFTSHPASR